MVGENEGEAAKGGVAAEEEEAGDAGDEGRV